MDLFADRFLDDRLHPVFKMLRDPKFLPERLVLEQWAEGFVDRDGKFVNEFQTTFESSMWELYLHAYLKEIGAEVDFTHHAPDFVVERPLKFCIEAAIAAPAVGGDPAIGYDATAIPEDFAEFNEAAAIRIANTLSAKISKHRSSYAKLPHAKDQPFVIAIAAFDRPFAHFAASRPIMAALYGMRYDEEAAKALGPSAKEIPKFPVSSATKINGAEVPLGFFCDDRASEVSAVIYSCLATWGKIRALADNPDALSFYQTLHPSDNGIIPLAHAHAVAQGLHAGYQRDFVTALHILLPQFENIVRALLKAASVLTTRTDDSGITMEVGLSALVKEPRLVEILGGDVVFGIRTLMCSQVGPNFRNDIAHGLATSADCNTLVGLYTWWFIFRLVFIQWHLASQPTDRPEVSASDSF